MAKKKDTSKNLSTIEEQLANRQAPDVPVDEKGTLVFRPKKESRKEKKLKARGDNMVENTEEVSGKYEYIIKHKAVEREQKRRKIIRWLLLFLLILLIIGGGAWGVTTFLEHNNFRVVIDRPGKNIFAISPTGDLKKTTEVYNIDGPRYMDNITLLGNEKTFLDIENKDGATNIEDLIAATFYLTNVSENSRSYVEYINVTETTKGIDEAMRIMLIKTSYNPDGTERSRTCDVYAAPHSYDNDGNPIPENVVPLSELNNRYYTGQQMRRGDNIPLEATGAKDAWLTIPFQSKENIMRNDVKTAKDPESYIIPPGGKVKFTLIIWLEGNDKDCVDDKLGGTMKLSLSFSEGQA